jgi:muramoyltetrapeptide carboxypeptidase LdcA involved in peptidoglycan recycling
MLRNYGMQGIFNKVSAVLFGRARDYTDEEKTELDQMIIDVIKGEFGNEHLPIVTNMDFGHTDPQFILPLGVKAEVDCLNKTFRLTEPHLQ